MSESNITKHAIAQGFKQLILKKDLHKISISDISSQCGLNRQTFYYHFQDKYELLNWIYYQECFRKAIDGMNFDNWNDHFEMMFTIMKEDEVFYSRTIRSDQSVFYDYLLQITTAILFDAMEKLDYDHQLQKQDKSFYARFYAYGISGSVIKWVFEGMKESPLQLASKLKRLVGDTEKIAYRKYLEDSTQTL